MNWLGNFKREKRQKCKVLQHKPLKRTIEEISHSQDHGCLEEKKSCKIKIEEFKDSRSDQSEDGEKTASKTAVQKNSAKEPELILKESKDKKQDIEKSEIWRFFYSKKNSNMGDVLDTTAQNCLYA